MHRYITHRVNNIPYSLITIIKTHSSKNAGLDMYSAPVQCLMHMPGTSYCILCTGFLLSFMTMDFAWVRLLVLCAGRLETTQGHNLKVLLDDPK